MRSRRGFLAAGLGGLTALAGRTNWGLAAVDLPPIRALTRAPGHHWFGYYDKWQFSPSDRSVLGMRTEFEGRTPRVDDAIEIGRIDLEDGDAWRKLGSSTAWGWQQGCMLQWVPGSESEVVWNDREDGRFVCRKHDTASGETRTIGPAIYSLCDDGRRAITADFARIQALRPGYGYVGVPDPHHEELVPEGSGVWTVDLETGASERIVSIARMAALEPRHPDMDGAKHYVNHLLVAPGSQRIVFLHRWRPDGGRAGFRTRMLTCDMGGDDLFVLDPSGRTSHFIWKDPEHLLAWSRHEGQSGFFLFRDRTREVSQVGAGVLTQDGHVTYVPNHPGWLLSDTYPDRTNREQHPFLFHEPSGRKVPLGHFHSPPAYRGEWRCDTHPRTSRAGTTVVIDSPHGGSGRQLWAIDVAEILGG